MKNKSILIAALCATALGGCANLNSIERVNRLPAANDGKVVTVDAKQRHLIMSRVGEDHLRICAEAAPDVFSALASSGGLSVDLSGQPSGEAAFSMSETAATIQRTQAVNLIRESFYRTCERYASGAIGRTDFIVQAARDQRAMVSVLAIEQLTGALRPPATIISGPGTQASVVSGREAAELVRDSRERRDLAKAGRDSAKTAVTEAEEENGVCGSGNNKDENRCAELRLALSNAETKFEQAEKDLSNTLEIAKSLTNSASASTSAGTNSTAGLTQSILNTANAEVIASAVVEIQKGANINEPLMFCMTVLTGENDKGFLYEVDQASRSQIVSTCLEILQKAAESDRQFITKQIDFAPGANQQILINYTDQSLPQDEQTRRTGILIKSMREAGLGETNGDLILLIAGGSEQNRRRLIDEAKKNEPDATGLSALQ